MPVVSQLSRPFEIRSSPALPALAVHGVRAAALLWSRRLSIAAFWLCFLSASAFLSVALCVCSVLGDTAAAGFAAGASALQASSRPWSRTSPPTFAGGLAVTPWPSSWLRWSWWGGLGCWSSCLRWSCSAAVLVAVRLGCAAFVGALVAAGLAVGLLRRRRLLRLLHRRLLRRALGGTVFLADGHGSIRPSLRAAGARILFFVVTFVAARAAALRTSLRELTTPGLSGPGADDLWAWRPSRPRRLLGSDARAGTHPAPGRARKVAQRCPSSRAHHRSESHPSHEGGRP